MPSSISWLDTSPQEQRAAREIVALFSEKGSLDEMGIGQIRDALSNRLFPGTSVLHTRARYYLFIPWCYLAVQRKPLERQQALGEANERILIETLRAGEGDKSGLIGRDAGAHVKTLPSSVFWVGMLRYGIRTFDGPIGGLPPQQASDAATELTDQPLTEWDPEMPAVPAGFPSELDGKFDLTREEAEWLRDRILVAADGSPLAHLLRRGELIPKTAFPWSEGALSREQFADVDRAYWFSNFMHGSVLLYNLLVAEKFQAQWPDSHVGADSVERVRSEIARWEHEFLRSDGLTFSDDALADLIRTVCDENRHIGPATIGFVRSWIEGAKTSAQAGNDVADDPSLRQLVRQREKRKGKQSRLFNDKMLANWGGSSGGGQLSFRWGVVPGLVNDILKGLNADAHA